MIREVVPNNMTGVLLQHQIIATINRCVPAGHGGSIRLGKCRCLRLLGPLHPMPQGTCSSQ